MSERTIINVRASLVKAGIRLTGAKRSSRTSERTRARLEELALRPASYAPPARLSRSARLAVRRVSGMPVYTVTPRDRPPAHRVLFLHGGAYTYEISPYHWKLIGQLAREVPAQVEVPIYPLAPYATAEQTVPLMAELLQTLLGSEAGPVTLMGDSAGGGMALAVAQHLRDAAGPQPARIVLIAPWLDVTVSHPRQREIDAKDRMLSAEGLRESGRLYAGNLDLRAPAVSPLFGGVRGLAPIDVFSGTYDLLNPDAHELALRCAEVGQPLALHEAIGMQHDYPILPLISEGRQARQTIVRLTQGR